MADFYDQIDWSKVDAPQNDPSVQAATSSLAQAAGSNPEQTAATLNLAKASNLPPDIVERNQAEVQKQVELDRLANADVTQNVPQANGWLADPNNAKLVSDNPGIIEDLHKTFKDIPSAFGEGMERNRLIDLRFNQVIGLPLTPDEQAEAATLSGNMNGQFGGSTWLSKGLTGLADYAPQMLKQFGRGAEGAAAGGLIGGAIGGGAGALAGGVGAIPGAAVGGGIGARTGYMAGSLFEGFRQMTALTYDGIENIKDDNGNKIDPDVARGAAIAVGLISAPMSATGLDKLAGVTPGVAQLRNFLAADGIKAALANAGMRQAFLQIGKKFAGTLTVEGLVGAGQQVAQIAGEEFSKQASVGNFQPISTDEALDRVKQGAEMNVLMAGTMGAASVPIDLYRTTPRSSFTPNQVAAHVQGINEAVRTSPLFQRSPDRFNDLVQQLQPDEKFYVNGEQAAAAINALPENAQAALFNAVPDLHKELTDAAATGADVAIRKADYASFIAPHPQADILKDWMKLDPADMSVGERTQQAEFLKNNPEAVADIQRQVQQLPPDATPDEVSQSMSRIVQKAMIEGGIKDTEARLQAPLYAKTLARFATPFGQSAIDAVNKNLLEFHTVDDQGNPIHQGSNFSTLLNDLQTVRAGKSVPRADDNMLRAINNFGSKLDAAGITPEAARQMSSRELLDKVYPKEAPKGPLDQAVDAVKTFTQNVMQGKNPLEPAPVDETPNVLRQAYKAGPDASRETLPPGIKDAPVTPYNTTKSPEFEEWFGKSKVTEPDGQPKVVFHGSGADIKAFSHDFTGKGNDQLGSGFYFTTDPSEASDYTTRTMPGEDEKLGGIENPSVYPVYLRIENPIDRTQSHKGITAEQVRKFIERAPAEHDGLSNWGENKTQAMRDAIPSYTIEPSDDLIRGLFSIANDFYGNDTAGFNKAVKDILGYDGIKESYDGKDHYVAFQPEQIKSVFNSGKFSSIDPDILKQTVGEGERGYITFAKSDNFTDRLRHVVVAFTGSKNFSTGAHEFAHFGVAQHRMFAEMARERIAAGDTNMEVKRIADDWEKLKEFVGATGDKFTVDQEEKAARAFEAYMREGHAPSEDLRRIFTRFRDWLVKIYKDISSLHVNINDDIRGVFDRWLASEEQIAAVKDKNGALAEIAQKLGLSDDIVGRVADYVNSATSHAEEKVYRELSAEQKRRETKAYQEEFASMSEKVKAELEQKREYNLMNYLKENGFKLLEGPETEGIDKDLLTDSPNTEATVHPDAVAELYGYDSGMDMLRALKATRPIDEAAASEARNRLLSKYPDMVAQGRIHNEAVNAIMNDRVLIALDLMIKELGRAKGDNSRVGMKQFAMAMAQQQVEDMKMSNANYSFRYDAARDSELRSALQASRKGDSNNAMLHLQRSMVNQIIYRSLEDFQDLKEKADKLFDRVDSKDKELAATKDIDFVGAARYILKKYGLGGEDFDIQTWMKDIQERNPDVMNDIATLATMISAPIKGVKDLTISEFRDIYDTIHNIYSTARNMKEGELAGKKYAIDQAVGELTTQMGPATKALHDGTQLTAGNKFRNGLNSAKAALRRVEEWCRAMDGGDYGPFGKYIFGRAREAQTSYKADREKWLSGYRDILVAHKELLKDKGAIDTQMIKNDSIGRQARLVFKNRMEMIGFMLHTGNESNLDKLLGGYGIDRNQYQAEMDRLENTGVITKEDRQLVQKLWDHIEGLKPQMQQAHRKLYGYRFQEIENSPIKTKYGVFRGGYWPAMIDRDQAANSKTVEEQLQESRQYLLPSTNKGFTKTRVQGYRQPLNTDLRLGSQHIDKVLRFVHLEPATRDISRIINRQEFRALLKAHDFDAMDGMLMPWLGRFATQTMEAPAQAGDRSSTIGRRIINTIRSSAMSQIIGYNSKVALQNIANMPVAVYRVGALNMARSFAKVTINPIDSMRDMKKASPMMAERLSTNATKISQQINQIIEGKGKFSQGRDFLNRHSMIFMHALDGYLGAITWHGAYGDAVSEGRSDADAIAHADQVARQVMGATDPVDISKFEASHPFVKMFTPFMSYFNEQANLAGTEFGNIARQYGWRGSPKMFMAYIALVAAPAMIGDLIYGSLQNTLPSDQDDDGNPLVDWMAWAAQSQVKYLSAFVPGGGPLIGGLMNTLQGKQPDDRISISPVLSATTGAARTAQELGGDGEVSDGRMIRDVMSALGFVIHAPLGQIAKPISYAVDVNEGNIDPDGPLNYIKGLVAGPPPKQK